MDYLKFLSDITTVPGTSGFEAPVAGAFMQAFAPHCDEVHVDANQSVVAVQRGSGRGPRVMLCAHIDEIGLMTTQVEDDGSIRFLSMGVAAQTLPAQEVTILCKDGPVYGVIGAMPPHLTRDDRWTSCSLTRACPRRRFAAGFPSARRYSWWGAQRRLKTSAWPARRWMTAPVRPSCLTAHSR